MPDPESASTESNIFTMGDLIDALKRRALPAIAVGLVVLVVTVLATNRITPLYEAAAVLTVEAGKTFDFDRTADDVTRVELNLLNTVRDQVLSVQVLRSVVEGMKLTEYPAYKKARDPIALLGTRVSSSTSRDSLSITIRLRDEDPRQAEEILTYLISVYQGRMNEVKSDKGLNVVEFLRQQVAKEQEKVNAARQEELAFMTRNELFTSSASAPENNQISQRLNVLNARLVDIQAQLITGRQLRDDVVRALALAPGARAESLLTMEQISRDLAVADLVRALSPIRSQEAQMQVKYGDRHPRLMEIRAIRSKLEAQLDDAVVAAGKSLVITFDRQAQQVDDLKRGIADQGALAQDFRDKSAKLRDLSERVAGRERLLQDLQNRLNQMEVSSSLGESRTRIIDPPSARNEPANIKKPVFIAIAVILGAVSALGTALVLDLTDVRLRGVKQIQSITKLPSLGIIPKSKQIGPLGRDGDPENPYHVGEAFRHLRASIRLARRNPEGCERIAITSCSPGEGKSTVCTRLAVSLAAMGAKVLLIDADLRKPTQDEQVGCLTSRGLSSLLIGEDCIAPVRTSRPNLDYLGVGLIPENPGELLLSPTFGLQLARFGMSYEYILIDTPPLSLVADAMSVAEHVDSMVLVLREGYTDKDLLRLVISRTAPIADRLLGFVLNGDISKAASHYGKYGYSRDGSATAPKAAATLPAPSQRDSDLQVVLDDPVAETDAQPPAGAGTEPELEPRPADGQPGDAAPRPV